MNQASKYSRMIKEKAFELDFLDCGITEATFLRDDAPRLQNWLKNGLHGEMAYMENHFDKRCDPRLLVEGARSAIVVLQNYYNPSSQTDPSAPKISKYAWGKDYHKIIRQKLKRLLAWMQEEFGNVSGRVFVDSAPVMERSLARQAGLGWIGKHSLLLNRRHGSWFFLGVILCDLKLEPDKPVNEYCGDCNRCVDACPTRAILPGRVVDARKCISYLTIEYKKDKLPSGFTDNMENYAFGCDICQEVCPWNRNAHPHKEDGLQPRPGLLELSREEWLNMDELQFDKMFEGSALKRTGYPGLVRNINYISGPGDNL